MAPAVCHVTALPHPHGVCAYSRSIAISTTRIIMMMQAPSRDRHEPPPFDQALLLRSAGVRPSRHATTVSASSAPHAYHSRQCGYKPATAALRTPQPDSQSCVTEKTTQGAVVGGGAAADVAPPTCSGTTSATGGARRRRGLPAPPSAAPPAHPSATETLQCWLTGFLSLRRYCTTSKL